MNRIIRVVTISIMLVGLSVCSAYASDGWELQLKVSAGHVSSKVSFGQQVDATAGRDGYYDVPAMLSGSLQAAFLNGGGTLWRDIRSAGAGEWQLQIDSQVGEPVSLSWNSQDLPAGVTLKLFNAVSGDVVDMTSASTYTIADKSGCDLLIRAGI